MKKSDEIAEVGKGISNHYRIDVLKVLEKNPSITLDELADITNIHYKTLSSHTARLHRSGLISKQYLGQSVQHSLTKRGKVILKFLRNLE